MKVHNLSKVQPSPGHFPLQWSWVSLRERTDLWTWLPGVLRLCYIWESVICAATPSSNVCSVHTAPSRSPEWVSGPSPPRTLPLLSLSRDDSPSEVQVKVSLLFGSLFETTSGLSLLWDSAQSVFDVHCWICLHGHVMFCSCSAVSPLKAGWHSPCCLKPRAFFSFRWLWGKVILLKCNFDLLDT